MAKQSKPQKKTIERVMHEFKHGELKRKGGRKVKNPKQAIAIALSEAGASKNQSPDENRKALRKAKEKERKGETGQARAEGKWAQPSHSPEPSKTELYEKARERNIPGRSRMSKRELERALAH